MVPSSVLILDGRGKVIISRNFRADAPLSTAQDFKSKVLDAEDISLVKPFMHFEALGYTLAYVTFSDIFLVATTRNNANASLLVSFLYKMIEVFTRYFKNVRDESIRDNFVIIYELLDEMIDFGYPQITDSSILKEFITQEYHVKEIPRPPVAATNAVSWRSEGVKHSRNEVFLDVIEKVNTIISGNGSMMRSEVLGQIVVKSYLSGMPELRLGLNEKLQLDPDFVHTSQREAGMGLEDVRFHQCVRLGKFDMDKTITFIPPDGEFQLMSYRLNTQLRPLIWVEAVIEERTNRVDYVVKARSNIKAGLNADNVKICVPVLSDVTAPKFKCTSGKAKYVPQSDQIVWSIKKMKAGTELGMHGFFTLPSVGRSNDRQGATRRPISLQFDIPFYAVSGLEVRFLKVIEKSNYMAMPWVRYITQAGDYQIRLM